MAVTPGGNFYIESSDLVANYPATSLAIATRLDKYALNPYTDATERDFLIQFPVQGQLAQTLDDNVAWKYDGTAWNSLSGGILQVVSYGATGSVNTTSTSYVTTGITATITPSSVTSKVLIMASGWFYTDGGLVQHTLFRGTVAGTNIAPGAAFGVDANYNGSVYTDSQGTLSAIYLDSPATASAQVYTVGFLSITGGVVTARGANAGTITLMEVSA